MNLTDDKQERQVVSRQRVSDHGEVYTAKREVCAMLDLVKEETERIDSRFLEPACGNGNFLVEILSRKMEAVRRQFVRNRYEYDLASAQAVSSMYGVELLPDNVEACRQRLLTQYLDTYRQHLHVDASAFFSAKTFFVAMPSPCSKIMVSPSPSANGPSSAQTER